MEPRKRKRLLLVLAGVALLVVSFWFLARNPEPTYEGRPLSEWIDRYATNRGATPRPAEGVIAAEAIRTIGTNALPWLLNWINYQEGPLLDRWSLERHRFPSSVSRRVDKLLFAGLEKSYSARLAFDALGPKAAPAIPRLHELALGTNDGGPRNHALGALIAIGPTAFPALTNILATTSFAGDLWAAEYISSLGTNAVSVVPILVKNLNRGDWRFAMASARALGALRLDPDLAIPALVEATSHPNHRIRREVVQALNAFGPKAISALPALTNLLSDPNPDVGSAAAAAIATINKRLQN